MVLKLFDFSYWDGKNFIVALASQGEIVALSVGFACAGPEAGLQFLEKVFIRKIQVDDEFSTVDWGLSGLFRPFSLNNLGTCVSLEHEALG